MSCPDRPHAQEYIDQLIEDFIPLAGDRLYADDQAIVGGLGHLRKIPVVVIGTERGRDTESRLKHNFGMARPERGLPQSAAPHGFSGSL